MAVAVSLNHQPLPSPFINLPPSSSPYHRHLRRLRRRVTFLPLAATSPPNQNPPPPPSIFLPFLQEPEIKPEPKPDPITITDPIHKFFKSQTSSQHQQPDPPNEGKFTLQKNRRSSWHLSPIITNTESEQPEPEPEPEYNNPEPEEPTKEIEESDSFTVNGVLELARNLGENVTLGEVLEGYNGKLTEKDCVQVLGLMGEEDGLTMCCLYFFEWMSLHEPSLVTPWAYSTLFPVLGRAKMGDKIMILFDNLPDSVEFKQIHVFNSAISALSVCGRYSSLSFLLCFMS